jgi:hypothetical protein
MLGDHARLLGERPLDLLRDLLELGLDEVGVGGGLLPVEHTRADLDCVRDDRGGVTAGLLAVADEANGGLVLDHQAVDREPVADRPDMRLAEWGRGFHGIPVAPYARLLTERPGACVSDLTARPGRNGDAGDAAT